jgi:hypothetical protein
MKNNDRLRIHIVHVGHGDCVLIEMPDLVNAGVRRVRFGMVDAGGMDADVKDKPLGYLKAFLECRLGSGWGPEDFVFEFLCLTHPHEDHYKGLLTILRGLENKDPRCLPLEFWDSGFRYNTARYLNVLEYLHAHRAIQFIRVTSGTEFHYGEVEVMVLAPSVDMRNRYDTYGVNLNDASIVLRIRHGNGVAILSGDAHFDAWGKVCEEFPRKKHLIYPPVMVHGQLKPDKRDPNHEDLVLESREDQLKCQLLKVAHHGSKNGTSYEYLDKLDPIHFAIPCDKDAWYQSSSRTRSWKGKFPHPVTRLAIGEQAGFYNASSSQIPAPDAKRNRVGLTSLEGTMIYTVTSGGTVRRRDLCEARGTVVSAQTLGGVL